MDVFKILSRSTKRIRKSSFNGEQKTTLPSAGSNPNPQLYHDPIPESRGQKRKHDHEKVIEREPTPVDEELNFFAPKVEKKKSAKSKTTVHDDTSVSQNGTNDGKNATPGGPKTLDEGECRQMLRSHRLKVMLLPSPAINKALVEKPRRSLKKRKSEEASKIKVKEESRQLYPQPLVAFTDLQSTYGISRKLGENIARQGYKIPTEVQMGSLPLLLRPDTAFCTTSDVSGTFGSDNLINFLAIAPTGSGKTLAFLIPVVNSIMKRRREAKFQKSHCLEAIVLAPTKELASQIVNEGKKLLIGTGVKVVAMRKGMRLMEIEHEQETSGNANDISSSGEDDEEIEDGDAVVDDEKLQRRAIQPPTKADILVTTPLVFLNVLSASLRDKSILSTVLYLVLDEADVLLDPLFREQTVGIWDACVNPDLQVTLWSATMGSNNESLVSNIIHSRAQRLELEKPSRVIRLVVGLKDSAIPNISHRVIYTATEPGKLIALRQLLHPTSSKASSTSHLRPPFLVFMQTIPRAIALNSELLYDIPIEAGGSSRTAVLHSDLSESARSAIMSRFRNGEIWVLITTDLLSRGVDFRGINGVVNYDIPTSAASYIHRVGRTGRAGREGGVAVTFYSKEDIPYFKNIATIITASEKQAGKTPEEGGLHKWLLDALPKVSKNEKKRLKKRGVEERRVGLSKMHISTKSGYVRRLENNKKGAVEASRRRKHETKAADDSAVAEASDWSGFDD